jgi:hypothetical protein
MSFALCVDISRVKLKRFLEYQKIREYGHLRNAYRSGSSSIYRTYRIASFRRREGIKWEFLQ